jgi:hypothetical protein
MSQRLVSEREPLLRSGSGRSEKPSPDAIIFVRPTSQIPTVGA